MKLTERLSKITGTVFLSRTGQTKGYRVFPPQTQGPRSTKYELYSDAGDGVGAFLGSFDTLDAAKAKAEELDDRLGGTTQRVYEDVPGTDLGKLVHTDFNKIVATLDKVGVHANRIDAELNRNLSVDAAKAGEFTSMRVVVFTMSGFCRTSKLSTIGDTFRAAGLILYDCNPETLIRGWSVFKAVGRIDV
jgi:hypothetical protein